MLESLKEQLAAYGPKALTLLAVVIGGLIVSVIARRLTRWVVDKSGLDALAEKAGAAKLLYAVGIRQGVAHVAGSVVYIAGLLLTGAATAEMLGLPGIASGVSALVGYLPRLVAAIAVVVGGMALAGLLRRIVDGFGRRREDVEQPEVLANLVYYAVMTISMVVAAGQAGLETGLIESLLTTLVAIGFAAIGLAFALGSRGSFHNLVAGHFFRRLARPGDKVRVGDLEGTVVRYFGVSVVLRTAEGEVAVPCKVLLDEQIHMQRLGAKARAELAKGARDEAPTEIS